MTHAVDFTQARERMVTDQLEARGVRDARVLAAMRAIPRHLFVEPALCERAYDDTPLPIGLEQTISQPFIVGCMSEALELPRTGARVLEVGTGSGYQAAVLAAMGVRVISIERLPPLAARARALLDQLGLLDRVSVEVADGTLGWPAAAPFDGIVVTAAAPRIPRPLVGQLAPHGALVFPMGDVELQTLVRLRHTAHGLREECLGECRFVKLRGRWGWDEG
jgi:protein-L-isoaspartate(D-aspartate) O-methyltransferase